MTPPSRWLRARRGAVALITAVASLVGAVQLSQVGAQTTAPIVQPKPVPRATCGPGSDRETGRQGRVTQEDVRSGRMENGASCNMELVGHHGTQAGLKVARFVDKQGNECAYYDTEVTFPVGGVLASDPVPGRDEFGTYVLDMKNPSKPVLAESLRTPAMTSPHESLLLNTKRGLLAAVMGQAAFYPGFIDVYDLNDDCRHPVLRSSLPLGVLGHESGWSPDGLTFWASSLFGGTLTAVDLTDPANPETLWVGRYYTHGLSISDDGNRAYLAAASTTTTRGGLKILDVSQVQARVPSPTVTVVSDLTWPTLSVPQITWPVTIAGRKYVIEMDEFGTGAAIGAARIIDIADEKKPVVVSDIRLEVNQQEHQAEQEADPGGSNNGLGDYTGHYCDIPRRVDPDVLACTFILSGLRLFDIRDPRSPREIAYYNAPQPKEDYPSGAYAMSNAVFVPERREIWYTDGQSGFYAVRVTNGVWDPNRERASGTAPAPRLPATNQARDGRELPATGGFPAPTVAGVAIGLWACVRLARRVVRG